MTLAGASVADLRARISAAPDGWIARAPHYGGAPPDIDAFLSTTKPWAAVHEADDVRLYRFEKGALVPP